MDNFPTPTLIIYYYNSHHLKEYQYKIYLIEYFYTFGGMAICKKISMRNNLLHYCIFSSGVVSINSELESDHSLVRLHLGFQCI
jgi:hypothetical protein